MALLDDGRPPSIDDARPLRDDALPVPDVAIPALADDQPIGSLGKAILASSVAGLLGAAIWGGITKVSLMEIGWIAIGIGYLCGIAVRTFGKGESAPYRVVAAATAVGGIVLGKVFAIYWIVQEKNPDITLAEAMQFLPQTLGLMDLLFVAIAVWQAWVVAVRPKG